MWNAQTRIEPTEAARAALKSRNCGIVEVTLTDKAAEVVTIARLQRQIANLNRVVTEHTRCICALENILFGKNERDSR